MFFHALRKTECRCAATSPFNCCSIHVGALEQRFGWLSVVRKEDLTEDLTGSKTADFASRNIEPLIDMQFGCLLHHLLALGEREEKNFKLFKPQEKIRVIKKILENNVPEKYLVIGMIAGLFTQQELTYFTEHRIDLSKQLLKVLLQKLRKENHLLF